MAHLVCKAMIVVLDTWVWEDAAEEEIPKSTYFNGVPAKTSRAAAQLFGDMVANNMFGKMPGRCLRNRWLSIDGILASLREQSSEPINFPLLNRNCFVDSQARCTQVILHVSPLRAASRARRAVTALVPKSYGCKEITRGEL